MVEICARASNEVTKFTEVYVYDGDRWGLCSIILLQESASCIDPLLYGLCCPESSR
jgi:hypothetical protein